MRLYGIIEDDVISEIYQNLADCPTDENIYYTDKSHFSPYSVECDDADWLPFKGEFSEDGMFVNIDGHLYDFDGEYPEELCTIEVVKRPNWDKIDTYPSGEIVRVYKDGKLEKEYFKELD